MQMQVSRSHKKRETLTIDKSLVHYPSVQTDSRFALISWKAQGVVPSKRMVFIHGALSHCTRHSDMFEWLIQKTKGQLQIDALDMVGHGLASGARGHVENFEIWEQDLLTYLQQREKIIGTQFLMGHSMGGLIALKLLLTHEKKMSSFIDALIFSNPCIRPHEVLEIPQLHLAVNKMANFLPYFRLPRIHHGKDLVNNPRAANAFETDSLIPKFITIHMAREIWRASQAIRSLSYFISKPSLFLLSDNDLVVDRTATMLFTRGIAKSLLTLREYKNSKHELLHEIHAPQVWEDIVSWMEKI
jgi:alpha-beta hydrolase superfamily lysophospholipase